MRTTEGTAARVEAPMRIGSAPECELRIVDRYVSTVHAEIRRVNGRLLLVDLASKNGTWLGPSRIEVCPVAPGLTVRIGGTVLEFVDDAVDAPRAEPSPSPQDGGTSAMLGRSAAFAALMSDLRRVARVHRPVLLRGETGTGKELAARFVHDRGERACGPFVAVNCASFVDGLAESALFGHVRGAFTGASRAHDGAFVSATGGTLFLDELGELPLPLQAKLLRVLESSRVRPVGSDDEVDVDVRVVAATHRDLDRMVEAGTFREDLYHRLGVLVLRLPPLRERAEDIPVLIEAFVRRASTEVGREVVLAPGCLEAAIVHPWPGNIRALHNAIVRAATMDDGPITAARLVGPTGLSLVTPKARPDPCPAHEGPQPGRPPAGPRDGSTTAQDTSTPALPSGDWASIEGDLLRRLVCEHGSIRRAAAALGVPRSTLGARLRRRAHGPG